MIRRIELYGGLASERVPRLFRLTGSLEAEHLRPPTRAMGRPRNKTQQAQDEGDRIRRAIITWLADKITDPSCPLTTEEMNHLRMVSAYFPEGREIADKIDGIFGNKPALRQPLFKSSAIKAAVSLALP
jgi:hypothetical protein